MIKGPRRGFFCLKVLIKTSPTIHVNIYTFAQKQAHEFDEEVF